jgi:hypothetical protein
MCYNYLIMHKKIRIIFRWSNYNHYSLSAIFGFLDAQLSSDKFELLTGETLKDVYTKINEFPGLTVLCFSFTSSQSKSVISEIKTIKEHYKDKVVEITGGPHPSALP